MTSSKDDLQSQPRPGYFLVRPSGQVVPLIAVDELPAEISLQGVSKTLELEETVGMLNLGVVHPFRTPYKALDKGNKPDDEGEKLDSLNKKHVPHEHITNQESTKPASLAEDLQASPGTTAPSKSPKLSAPRTLKPKSQVCKHWCAYGTCKWNENCRFLHSMPSTRAALHEAGLYDWPTWYRAQNPGLFNVLRRRGMVRRDPDMTRTDLAAQGRGCRGRRMIPDSKGSLVADGRVVGFVRGEDVVEVLERLGEKEKVRKNGQEREENIMKSGVKKDMKETSLMDV